jgi:hypothetical protein
LDQQDIDYGIDKFGGKGKSFDTGEGLEVETGDSQQPARIDERNGDSGAARNDEVRFFPRQDPQRQDKIP